MANVGTGPSGQPLIGTGNGSSPTYAAIGTNSGLGAHGIVTAEGNGAFTVQLPGAAGTVLTSNGSTLDPTFQTLGSIGGITSITGSSGGAEVPLAGNFNILGAGSLTVVGSANTQTVQLTGLTNHALLVGAGTTTITKVGPSATSGQVLQSQGSSTDPAFSTATYPSTAGTTGNVITSNGTNFVSQVLPTTITTIDGDSSSVTGATISLLGHTGSSGKAGATVAFVGVSATQMDLELTDASDNIFIGRVSGNGSYTGSNSIGIGAGTFQSFSSGTNNVGIGYTCMGAISSGTQNTGLGAAALGAVTTTTASTGIGYSALHLATGGQNTALGANALLSLVAGTTNFAAGFNAGTLYTSTESNNVLIMNTGVAAESNVMRLGTQGTGTGQVNATYIAGIAGVTASNPEVVTVNSSTGQMGIVATSNYGVLISSSAGVPSWLANGTTGQVLTATTSGTPSWSAPAGGGLVTTQTILTSAQVKALHGTPITIVAAQGAGTFINVIAFSLKLTYGGTNAFVASASQTINCYYTSAGGSSIAAASFSAATIASTSNQIGYFILASQAGAAATGYENQPIIVTNPVTTEISGNAANDNTIAVNLTYQVLTL